MFSFHVNHNLDKLFETLLGTLLYFEAHGELWVNIAKMQRLTLGY